MTGPNEMRVFLKMMRNGKPSTRVNEVKKELTMRDMLKITRKLNEQSEEVTTNEPVRVNKKTDYDQKREEDKFNNFIDGVVVKFVELEVYDDLIFWGGTVDGEIQFIYKVTPYEASSGVEFNYLNNFQPDNPENTQIIEKIESYYDSFYEYWRDMLID